jgi:hypothetical protein
LNHNIKEIIISSKILFKKYLELKSAVILMGQTSSSQTNNHKRREYIAESITDEAVTGRFKNVNSIYTKVLAEEDKIVFDYKIRKNKTGTKVFMYRDLIDGMTNFQVFDHKNIEIHHRTILYSKPTNIFNKVRVCRNTFCYVCNKFSDPESFVKHVGLPPDLELITEAYLSADGGKAQYPPVVPNDYIMYVTFSDLQYCKKCEPTKNYCCVHCCPHLKEKDLIEFSATDQTEV